MSPVKLAIIGLGLMGNRHIEIVNSFDGCDLVAVCDLNPDLRALADRHKIPFFQDIDKMLDHTQPDGAILATQSAAHIETFEACARRGVHALIEKPVADATQAALRIADHAAAPHPPELVGP
ncbi:MAG: gfo/Idh/MocA family oxidoreductase, partial [Dehalococcoidia bacterium]|nr:gfo/Idh/MocA family oxidoreductase [Dehalococcoidia bacterium]